MRTPARRAGGKQTTLRHVWLASLGATSIARVHAIDVAGRLVVTAEDVATQATAVSRDAGLVLRGAALTVRERLSPLRAGIEAQLASGLFAVLSAFERP